MVNSKINYKCLVLDEYDNCKATFLVKADGHSEAITKAFKKWMKSNFTERAFGNYFFRMKISEDELE